jgi:hypothetical protein
VQFSRALLAHWSWRLRSFAVARVRIPGSLPSEIAMTTPGTWDLTDSAMLPSIIVSVELSLFALKGLVAQGGDPFCASLLMLR